MTLTCTDAAELLGMTPRNVMREFDRGAIRGYRIQHSLERRIPLSQVTDYARRRGVKILLPVGPVAEGFDPIEMGA